MCSFQDFQWLEILQKQLENQVKETKFTRKKTNGMAKVHSNTIIKIIKRNGKELIEKQN